MMKGEIMKEFIKKEFVRKLKIIKSIESNDYDMTERVMEEIRNDSAKILEINDRRDDYYKKIKPITKESLITKDSGRGYNELLSTYQGCRIAEFFYLNEDSIKCIISICNGNNNAGERTSLRFIFSVLLNVDFINNIKEKINSSFYCYLENEYYKYLENQKEIWIKKRMNSLLKEIKK
jgi:hypothetical protein